MPSNLLILYVPIYVSRSLCSAPSGRSPHVAETLNEVSTKVLFFVVSIVPLLLAVVAGQEEEQRATHENRLHSPPAVAHSLNEAIQVETSQPVLFLDTKPTHPVLLLRT